MPNTRGVNGTSTILHILAQQQKYIALSIANQQTWEVRMVLGILFSNKQLLLQKHWHILHLIWDGVITRKCYNYIV